METFGVGVLCVALLWHYGNQGGTAQLLPPTRSTIDNKDYRVQPTTNALDAANQLCRVRQAVGRVLNYLQQQGSWPVDVADGVRRLLRRHPNIDTVNLVELDPRDAKHTLAYNEGKSTHIFLCMRQNPPSEQLGPDEVLIYIVLHELAHSMIDGYAPTNSHGQTIHDANFRKHNEYLNSVGELLGLLVPGKVPGTAHCGVIMPEPADSV